MPHMLRCSIIILLLVGFGAITSANAQIVALGASSTAGYGVGASSAYPAQLEEILRARGRPISVSNASHARRILRGEPPTPGDGCLRSCQHEMLQTPSSFDDGDRD